MKIDVAKDGYTRAIKPSKLQNYLDAGWKQSSSEPAEEIKAILKPPAKVKAATNAEDNTIDTQGE
jgi:hypothetical protein